MNFLVPQGSFLTSQALVSRKWLWDKDYWLIILCEELLKGRHLNWKKYSTTRIRHILTSVLMIFCLCYDQSEHLHFLRNRSIGDAECYPYAALIIELRFHIQPCRVLYLSLTSTIVCGGTLLRWNCHANTSSYSHQEIELICATKDFLVFHCHQAWWDGSRGYRVVQQQQCYTRNSFIGPLWFSAQITHFVFNWSCNLSWMLCLKSISSVPLLLISVE